MVELAHEERAAMVGEFRGIKRVIEPHTVIEGAGVRLRRSFGPSRENRFDPFLLFDHFAFNDPIEGPIVGFPMHPHRGIETVTYMLEGNTRHRDSLGNLGLIGPGDVQWMTSGSGILHEEMPKRGPSGNVYGFQLWVNLPRALKMSRPRYQEVKAADIPKVAFAGGSVGVVAGEFHGIRGPVTEIAAQPIYMHVSLDPGERFSLQVPEAHTLVVYVFQGVLYFGASSSESDARISAVKMAVLGEGERLTAHAGSGGEAEFILMAGAPFNEPIVPHGPFVMNTEQEIRQALSDLRAGTFVREQGQVKA
jgi:redox-sensitive bicupin YhaK (pirin superfamily)